MVSCFPLETSSVHADDQWVAQPMHIVQSIGPMNVPFGYSPSQIRAAYGLPSSGGAGATVAIIDAYNTSSITYDSNVFSQNFSLPQLILGSNFQIHKMNTTIQAANSDWATETCLDVEWAHAIAPNANILLVEAASDQSNDLLSAVQYAARRSNVVAVSMSWGGIEDSSVTSYDSYFTSSYGAVFFASSGDNGSASGVNWPACSPNVVAVGGTRLSFNLDGTLCETAWSESGGGVSLYEPATCLSSKLRSWLF